MTEKESKESKAFRQQLRAIEAAAEKESGLSPLPREFWCEVALHIEDEEQIGQDGEIKYCDGDPEANEDALGLYSRYVDSHIGTAKIAVKALGRATGDNEKSKPKTIYRKTFERRFHLLAFVLDRKGFEHRARKGFWKEMTAEWNREHPYDQRTPEDLRARYADYIKDDSLWNSYVATRIAPIYRRAAELPERMMEAAHEFARQHPEAKTVNDLIRIQHEQRRQVNDR